MDESTGNWFNGAEDKIQKYMDTHIVNRSLRDERKQMNAGNIPINKNLIST